MKKGAWIIMALLVSIFINLTSVSALSLVVHVPEKYTDVHAGERVYFEIEVKYPENPTRKDLRLTYDILKDNAVISQSQVLKAIETQASFIDFIVIPEGAESGLYRIKVKVSDYEGLSEEVSTSFQVIGKEGDKIKLYFFILLGAIIIVGLLVGWEIYRLRDI